MREQRITGGSTAWHCHPEAILGNAWWSDAMFTLVPLLWFFRGVLNCYVLWINRESALKPSLKRKRYIINKQLTADVFCTKGQWHTSYCTVPMGSQVCMCLQVWSALIATLSLCLCVCAWVPTSLSHTVLQIRSLCDGESQAPMTRRGHWLE